MISYPPHTPPRDTGSIPAQLICPFVFRIGKIRFSHDAAHIIAVLPVGDNGFKARLDDYTISDTDCPCKFDTTRGDCACCQNGGCQCDKPYHNKCVRCGSSGQCGASGVVLKYIRKTCLLNVYPINPTFI